MPVSYPRKVIEAEVVDPAALTLPLRDAVLQDIFTLFHLDRPFKFVSKTSNFFIPIVGWSMFLTGMTAHKTKYLLVMSPKSKQLDTM